MIVVGTKELFVTDSDDDGGVDDGVVLGVKGILVADIFLGVVVTSGTNGSRIVVFLYV